MEKEKAAIAAEIKISITSNTFEEVETMIKQIKDACKSSEYKLSLSLEGNFSQKPTPDSDFWTAFFTKIVAAYTEPSIKLETKTSD